MNSTAYTGETLDNLTGLYYMNARYYNPATGRFLTQDSYTGNPYDPWTQHLYAYCGNNPVNMVDPTGHIPSFNMAHTDGGNNDYKGNRKTKFLVGYANYLAKGNAWDEQKEEIKALGTNKLLDYAKENEEYLTNVAVGVASVELSLGRITQAEFDDDLKNFDLFNTDEGKVASCNFFSAYKGVLVFREYVTPSSYAIGGQINLHKSVKDDVWGAGRNTVMHEYGHLVQEVLLGELPYVSNIAIPSVWTNLVNGPISSNDYYSQPWEQTADFFGSVNRGVNFYNTNAEINAGIYFMNIYGW